MTDEAARPRTVQLFEYPPHERGLVREPVAESVELSGLEDVDDQIRRTARGLSHGDYLAVRTYVEDDGRPHSNVVLVHVTYGQIVTIGRT